MKKIYGEILNLYQKNSPLILATVTASKGSTPQKPGSSALFGPTGRLAGTVGGGYVERSVEGLVENALRSGKSGHYHFDLDNEISVKDIGICGGCISILIDAFPGKHTMVFEKMKSAISRREPGVLVTRLIEKKGDYLEITRRWIDRGNLSNQKSDDPGQLEASVREMIAIPNPRDYRSISSASKQKNIEYLLESVVPLPRLVIVGAGHIGKELCHLGSRLDFEVTVIDDRQEYANIEMLPGANEVIVGDIGSLLDGLNKAGDTYIMIVSRSHSEDASALKACINSDAGYIGMIGSRRKIKLMKEKFLSENICTSETWDSVYTPVGIDINAKTVEEIGISIAAQLIQVRSEKIRIKETSG